VRLLLALVATALLASPAAAGDYMDTTITFVAGDDNVMAGAGETIPSSPRADFRPRQGNSLFFDNYDTRNTGEETRTHLVLYKAFEGFFSRVTPEAALVIEWDANRTARNDAYFEETGSRRPPGGIRDDGSYLALGVDLAGAASDRLSIVLFPFDSDRFRLGYSWELTWGGRGSFILAREVPGVRVSYERDDGYAFVGFKTARTQVFTLEDDDPARDENETVYGVLAGGGVDVTPNLRVELGAGYFQKGTIPIDREDLQGTPIDQVGVSAQVIYYDGLTPTRSVDTRLYRNQGDVDLRPKSFGPRSFGYQIATEFTYTSQVLEDAGDLGSSAREGGYAGDLNGRLETGAWTFNADIVLRSLEFLVQDTPGLFPFSTLPGDLDVSPEWFAAVGVGYRIEALRLVPGLTLGVQSPATAEVEQIGSDGTPQVANLIVRKTKNVLGQTFVEPTPLPPGTPAKLIYSARLALESHLSDLVTIVGEAQLTWNENLVSNDPERGERTFDNPLVLGLSVLAQARF
jgi:opacity protein-like surface antigen